jgi:lactate dehydrogenase-like 2-hydroxyacid dehydrogenase
MAALYLPVSLPPFLVTPLTAMHTLEQAPTAAVRGMVVPGGFIVSESLLSSLPNLEIISVFGVGYDGVPITHCEQRGIRVTNTPDVLTEDVADIATALVLMTSRRLAVAEKFTRAGSWCLGAFPLAHALRGKTAGIVGLGRIGKAIAHRLTAHGLKIAYFGRQAQAVAYDYCDSLSALAQKADFLIVACPGGNGTRHLINAEVLGALGSEGTLINIARGSVVDEEALIVALNTGVIRGAGLDVFENEPHVPAELIGSEKVVIIPHVGSATHETRQAMADLVLENIAAHFADLPLLTPVC